MCSYVDLFWIVCRLFFEFNFLLLEKKLLFLFLRQAFFFYILFKFSTLSGIINKSLNHSYQSWNLFQLPERKKPRFSKVGAEWKTTALEIKKKRAPVLMQQPTKKKALPALKTKQKKLLATFSLLFRSTNRRATAWNNLAKTQKQTIEQRKKKVVERLKILKEKKS